MLEKEPEAKKEGSLRRWPQKKEEDESGRRRWCKKKRKRRQKRYNRISQWKKGAGERKEEAIEENVERFGEDKGGDGGGDCPYFGWHKVSFIFGSWYSTMFLI